MARQIHLSASVPDHIRSQSKFYEGLVASLDICFCDLLGRYCRDLDTMRTYKGHIQPQ